MEGVEEWPLLVPFVEGDILKVGEGVREEDLSV